MAALSTDPKILLLGKNGQLGWELQRLLAPLGLLQAIDYDEVDLADETALRDAVRGFSPQLIVNAAAYTDVDGAESEKERAFAINATAPGVLAEESKRCGAALVHYSTDYVYNGQKGEPYTESDSPDPLSVYGASKLAGDRAIEAVDDAYIILRTAWVYSLRGSNFVTKVLDWSRHQPVLRIVDDQVSNPTWARYLAQSTAQILRQGSGRLSGWLGEHRGVYHLAGGGHTSRYEWARAILDLDPMRVAQATQQVLPAATSDFPTPARRPRFSALDTSRISQTFGMRVVDWRQSLRLALAGT